MKRTVDSARRETKSPQTRDQGWVRAAARETTESWSSPEHYYKTKYTGLKKASQFIRWAKFWLLHFLWGNGESILKLIRSIALILVGIAVYDTVNSGNAQVVSSYWESFKTSPSIFLGVQTPGYPAWVLSLVAASRFISVALLTALLVKRFGRR